MPNDPKNPQVGELSIDLTDMQSYLVDLPEGGTVGLMPEKEGFAKVKGEIIANQPGWGGKAGVTVERFNQFMTLNEQIATIDARLPAVAKLYEMLTETRAKLCDQRERVINGIAASAERAAEIDKEPELLGKYQETRNYRSAIAVKAVKTRKKNEEAAKAAPKPGDAPADGAKPVAEEAKPA